MSNNWNRGFWLGFAVVLFLGASLGLLQKSQAQSDSGQYILVTGSFQNDQFDYLYLLDTTTKRVVVYRYDRTSLELVDARNIKYDFQPDFYQKRTGEQIKKVMDASKKNK